MEDQPGINPLNRDPWRRLDFAHHSRRLFRSILSIFLLIGAECAAARAEPTAHPEVQLQAAVVAMEAGDYGGATRKLEEVLRREPNYRLAQLLYGQTLALRSGAHIGSPLTNDQDPRLRELLDEYHARTDETHAQPEPGLLPDGLIKLADEVRHAVIVDLAKTRLYVVENGKSGPRVVRSYYAAIARNGFGKQSAGDLRTPVGVYHITGWTPGAALPPLYGAGAFPVNYPNSWDRSLGKSGYGIWLHGVPANTYVRPPRSSEGCVTMANEDLLALQSLLSGGSTPVILADKIDWQPAAKLAAEREALTRDIENWRRRWSRRDTDAYLGFYASDFKTDDGMGKSAFAESMRRVNAGKKRVEIKLAELSLFAYPGEHGLVVAQFVQNYRSDNFTSSSRKDQYWRQQANGDWKIVREENR